jgi:hypothetical protein
MPGTSPLILLHRLLCDEERANWRHFGNSAGLISLRSRGGNQSF